MTIILTFLQGEFKILLQFNQILEELYEKWNLVELVRSIGLPTGPRQPNGIAKFGSLKFQNIFPLANSFAKWENVRRWQAPYGTRVARIRTTLAGA